MELEESILLEVPQVILMSADMVSWEPQIHSLPAALHLHGNRGRRSKH